MNMDWIFQSGIQVCLVSDCMITTYSSGSNTRLGCLFSIAGTVGYGVRTCRQRTKVAMLTDLQVTRETWVLLSSLNLFQIKPPISTNITLLVSHCACRYKLHSAEMWVSCQDWNQTQLELFYQLLEEEQPTWLSGVVYGPHTRDTIAQVRARVPGIIQESPY
jgi:hypothetical protein